jgi:multiple sugar transport system permease protein
MEKVKKIVYAAILLLILVICLFPLLWTFSISIKPKEMATIYPPVFVFKPTFTAYIELFTVNNFGPCLTNSLILSINVLVISLTVGSIAAYSFARFRMGGKAMTYGILIVQMIPPMVITFPLYLTIRALRMIDSIPGLVFAQLTYHLPFVMWVMRQFFMQIPVEIDESARIDGASNYRLFFTIILPISTPGLVSSGIFVFLGSWNDLLFPLMLTNTKAQTITIAAANFVTVYKTLWTQVDASVFLMIIPPVILMIFARKYIVAGLVGTSIKG